MILFHSVSLNFIKKLKYKYLNKNHVSLVSFVSHSRETKHAVAGVVTYKLAIPTPLPSKSSDAFLMCKYAALLS